MAGAFGISAEFLDRELSRFIASGRLHCKIDKVPTICALCLCRSFFIYVR
jgi:hypothetical protein